MPVVTYKSQACRAVNKKRKILFDNGRYVMALKCRLMLVEFYAYFFIAVSDNNTLTGS